MCNLFNGTSSCTWVIIIAAILLFCCNNDSCVPSGCGCPDGRGCSGCGC